MHKCVYLHVLTYIHEYVVVQNAQALMTAVFKRRFMPFYVNLCACKYTRSRRHLDERIMRHCTFRVQMYYVCILYINVSKLHIYVWIHMCLCVFTHYNIWANIYQKLRFQTGLWRTRSWIAYCDHMLVLYSPTCVSWCIYMSSLACFRKSPPSMGRQENFIFMCVCL